VCAAFRAAYIESAFIRVRAGTAQAAAAVVAALLAVARGLALALAENAHFLRSRTCPALTAASVVAALLAVTGRKQAFILRTRMAALACPARRAAAIVPA